MDAPELEILLKGNTNYIGRLYIQKHYPEFYQYLIEKYNHIPWKKFSELLYLYYHNMDNRPKCKCCNNLVDFLNFIDGYRIYCSVKCQTNDPEIIQKSLKVKRNKYGVHCEKVVQKTKQTKLERYGNENYVNIDKMKQTSFEKYGVEHFTNRKKAEQTTKDRYGYKNAMQNKDIAKKSLQNKIEKYGVDNVSNQIKTKQTCQDRYGVDNVSHIPKVIKKIENTKLERYGDSHYSNNEKYKQTCLERYGVDNVSKVREFQKKKDLTKHKNNSFVLSSIETKFSNWLEENNINFLRQYKDIERYPFNCDFYFPGKDLFIEIQGNWVHGPHPYDESNPDDIKLLNKWKDNPGKYYLQAIETWTVSDPYKRKTAKDNNLNWIEIFTNNLNELIEKTKGAL